MVEGPKGLAVDEFRSGLAAIADLDEFAGVRDRQRAQHDVFDEGEDGGVAPIPMASVRMAVSA
jgi:hypothetical protein